MQQQDRERAHHQGHRQQVGHDELLDEYLGRVEQHRRGRERGAPVRQPVAADEHVHHRGDAEPGHMLQSGDEQKRMERAQDPQEKGVSARVHHVRGQMDGAPQIVVGVQPEQDRGLEPDHRYQPWDHGHAKGYRKDPVAADETAQVQGGSAPAVRGRRLFGGGLPGPGPLGVRADVFLECRHLCSPPGITEMPQHISMTILVTRSAHAASSHGPGPAPRTVLLRSMPPG
jgi:hypothetical protein